MHFYHVAVASSKYHGDQLLTYSSQYPVEKGSLVYVPLQKYDVLGFVIEEVVKPDFSTKQLALIDTGLCQLSPEILSTFNWLRTYYPAPLGIVAQLFLPTKLPKNLKLPIAPSSTVYRNIDNDSLPELTKDQKNALNTIQKSGSYMIHGETGSGKTRIYIELAKRAAEQGESSIILTPEISLTSQLALEFEKTFDSSRLIILHSQLTEATRRNIWLKLLQNEQSYIIIGPRSALFSPIKNIGLIVVDESHELAYKQENAPHYHATRLASKLAELHKAILILGSATPSIQDYFIAKQRERPILQISSISSTNPSSQISIIDMRQQKELSKHPHLSTTLIEKMKNSLDQHKQILLFINRRGTARIVLCNNCGWQATCPHCDLPLTYHHDSYTLQCHTCGIVQKAVSSCPDCDNTEIVLKSVGTKSIVSDVQKLFPAARVARFDTDNNKGERVHELYAQIRSGEIDILVGTQILAKGLDLPKLGLVGVINADASLYLPDFTAQERTYQLLYQVIGRIGRSSQKNTSTAVIQTYSPDNPVVKAASKKDWNLFYDTELKEREQFLFPPFCHLLKISCKRAKNDSAQAAAEKVADNLRSAKLNILIEGPSPAFHEKVQNKYVWQLVVKSKRRDELLKVIKLLPHDWSYDIDPINLL